MDVIIPRYSTILTKKTKIFSTFEDNQTSILIRIFEGERQLTKDNYQLGKFVVDGIPPMPKGQPQIEIAFDLDINYILNITAVEKSTGKSKKMLITNEKERLSKDDIIRLSKEEKN